MLRVRLQSRACRRAAQAVEHARDEVEVDPAHQRGVLAGKRVERAVAQTHLAVLAARLEALGSQDPGRAVELVATSVVRRADRAPAGLRLVAQRLRHVTPAERPLEGDTATATAERR